MVLYFGPKVYVYERVLTVGLTSLTVWPLNQDDHKWCLEIISDAFKNGD